MDGLMRPADQSIGPYPDTKRSTSTVSQPKHRNDARSRARTQRGRAPNSSVLAQLVDLIQTKHRLGLD